MSKGKKKMEIDGSDIRVGVLHEGGSLNGWKLPILPPTSYTTFFTNLYPYQEESRGIKRN
jgi:hypothetical protein